MKTYVADVVSHRDISLGTEAKLLSRAGRDKISGIITTNYDTLCETLFPSFKVYIGESDLLFSEPSFAQELYKIHGSVGNPDGLVLTEADYAKFSARRKYLSAKLLTIFAEYPVIFLGYSLHDDNVRSILADICECVPNGKLERLHDRMTFVDHGEVTRVSDHTMDLDGRLLPMTRITTDDFSSAYERILRSKRLYSPRVIRELKGNAFRLAEKMGPTSEVVTSGFDTLLNRLDPNQKIAIQIAVSPAAIGKPITPEDIYQDVLLDDLGMDHRFIVDNYLNVHVQRLAGAIPFYKYTADLGDEVGKPVERYRARFSSLDSFRTKSDRERMGSVHRRFEGVSGVTSLAEACLPNHPFVFVPCLRDEEIDVEELGAVLASALLATDEHSPERKELLKNTAFRKCVRIYDFLRYARR